MRMETKTMLKVPLEMDVVVPRVRKQTLHNNSFFDNNYVR